MNKIQPSRAAVPRLHDVLSIDADPAAAQQTREALADCRRCRLVAQVENIDAAITWLKDHQAHVVLLTFEQCPSLTNLQTLTQYPDGPAVVVLMNDDESRWSQAAMISGAQECLTRSRDLNGPVLDRALAYAAANHRYQGDLGRFMSYVSHDLQAPARQVRGFVRILRQRLGSDRVGTVEEPLKFIEQAADQQRVLLDSLVQYVRARQCRPRLQALSLASLVGQAQQSLEPNVANTVLHLHCQGDGVLYGDPELLRMSLVQLLDNAVRYRRHTQVHVRIWLETHQEDLCLAVADDGQGMDSAAVAKAIQPFSRLPTTVNATPGVHQPNSMGLGLSVCQRVVDAHRGALDLQSTPGLGTTVRLWLPKNPEHLAGPQQL